MAKYGLLLVELHTIDPEEAAESQGVVPATAYDATHGFSDQYIVEVSVFDAIAEEAGLTIDKNNFRYFLQISQRQLAYDFLNPDYKLSWLNNCL